MNHLYAIKLTVSDKNDFFENLKRKTWAYVLAECPYQAMFFIRSKLSTIGLVSNCNENVRTVKPNQYNQNKTNAKNINEAVSSKQVVLDIAERPYQEKA